MRRKRKHTCLRAAVGVKGPRPSLEVHASEHANPSRGPRPNYRQVPNGSLSGNYLGVPNKAHQQSV